MRLDQSRLLLNSAHGRGLHDEKPAEGCPACALVASGEPLLCAECRQPMPNVGTCADCLFKHFDDE